MAKLRSISTKFWSDSFIVQLEPLERYFFLYLLTNEHTNIGGVYELPLKYVAFETGLDLRVVEKFMERFEKAGKVYYMDGWIGIKNFVKNQSLNPKMIRGVEICLEAAPPDLISRLSIDYQALSIGFDNTNTNTNTNTNHNRSTLEKSFKDFWEIYPRKVGRQAALQAWMKLGPDDSLKESIIKAVERASKTEQWRGATQYIPHPSTFLNGRRWEDEGDTEKKSITLKSKSAQ